jgi:KDO2-lipid IV(A) lauroyltransferase
VIATPAIATPAIASALTDHVVAAAYVAGWRGVGHLPENQARRIFDGIARHLHRRNGPAVQRLRANLAKVRPDLDGAELDALTREGVRSYLRYWCESFRLPSWPREDVVARTRTVHEERLRTPYEQGRGVVAALPHQGNWDWAGAWACATGAPVTTVAERLRPERLYDEFVAFRASLGMEILPLTGGEAPMPRLAEVLQGGGFVPLLADRDLSRSAVEVRLCGHPARMPGGPARLAQSTGAALVPVTTAYAGEDLEITFHPEVGVGPGETGVEHAMQQVADAFTLALRQAPQDWHMMQRVFAADLDPGPVPA